MISQFSIAAVMVGALGAALAVHLTHRLARDGRWAYVPRYVTGGLIVMGAYAPVLFTTLDWHVAGFLLLMLGVVFAAAGIMTWLEHDADHQRETAEIVAAAERMNRRIEHELEQ